MIAAGTSSPALFLSLIALLQPSATDDTGIGTIVGSAIFNVCVTIGLSAVFSPPDSVVEGRPVIRDVVFNVLAFCWIMGSFADGYIYWYEAMLGMMLYGVYVVFMIFNRKIMRLVDRTFGAAIDRAWAGGEMPELGEYDEEPSAGGQQGSGRSGGDPNDDFNNETNENEDDGMKDLVRGDDDDGNAMVRQEHDDDVVPVTMDMEATADLENQPATMTSVDMEAPPMAARDTMVDHDFYVWKRFCGKPIYRLKSHFWERPETTREWLLTIPVTPFQALFHYTLPNALNPTFPRGSAWITFGLSLGYLLAFTVAMIIACQKIGCLMGLDEAVVGATLLAWGSSLPDALTSVFVARAGKGNMAVSNVLGANIFDVLFALGLPWFLLTVVEQTPVEVGRGGAVIYTAILFAALFLLMGTLFFRRWRLGKVIAIVLFTFYLLFFIFIILHTVNIIKF